MFHQKIKWQNSFVSYVQSVCLILKSLFREKSEKKTCICTHCEVQKFENVRAIKRKQFARGESMKLFFHLERRARWRRIIISGIVKIPARFPERACTATGHVHRTRRNRYAEIKLRGRLRNELRETLVSANDKLQTRQAPLLFILALPGGRLYSQLPVAANSFRHLSDFERANEFSRTYRGIRRVIKNEARERENRRVFWFVVEKVLKTQKYQNSWESPEPLVSHFLFWRHFEVPRYKIMIPREIRHNYIFFFFF